MKAGHARRMALWLNGSYMINTDTSGLPDEIIKAIPIEDLILITELRSQIGHEMIEKSGIDQNATFEEAVEAARSLPPLRIRK